MNWPARAPPGTAWSASRRSWTGGSGCSPSPAPDRALTGRSHPGGEPLPDAVGAEQPVDLAEHRRPVLAGDQAGRPGRGAGLERLLARAEGAERLRVTPAFVDQQPPPRFHPPQGGPTRGAAPPGAGPPASWAIVGRASGPAAGLPASGSASNSTERAVPKVRATGTAAPSPPCGAISSGTMDAFTTISCSAVRPALSA